MQTTPRDYVGALQYLRDQERHLSPPSPYGSTWHNDCQALAHIEWGVMEGGSPSAYAQWLSTPAEHKHVGGDPAHAPLGALLCSKRAGNPFGHIWTAVHQFPSGVAAGRGPDMNPNVYGGVSKFRRDAPMTVWGHTYLGWIEEVNGWHLDLTHTRKVAQPIQDKQYQRLDRSIQLLTDAVETAKADHDKNDVAALRKQIRQMKALYAKIKHS